ncbi:MAG: alpha-amylase family glycosyl hydrolase [Paludisphaera borealis]|uniref:alpha-amylase family glycosyl hydrolase n=1 Tax=Paludisphaera borealis TaxID=1387353 RepID=UPI00283B4F77|nr:alpha-amylase family glycosyl hydrolase [Paludisphaera borealis]MDR3619882.1 alpha-amylase family glycosyl hydrolase [Paludisphaera borealis]
MPKSLTDQEVQAVFDRAAAGPSFGSPEDWRDVWVYFLMVDRFNRSDGLPPANLPYDAPFGGYQGGTFNGVRDKLRYIKDLGAGAVWLSPVLKNRLSDAGSFHGYGIQDFLSPEPRFASAPGKEDAELRALVDEAHALGLYVIFDIVLHHAGDVFGYKGTGSTADGSSQVLPIEWRDATGRARSDFPVVEELPPALRQRDGLIWPAQLQRNHYFRRKGKGDEAGGDFESLKQLATDVFEDGVFPVRNALILAYQYAIARYDVDGFRIDTLKYIERDFAQTFGNAMREYALSIGKKNFFTYGEVFDGEDRIAQFVGRNTSDSGDAVGVDAALDFPLFFHLPSVAKGFAPPTDVIDVFRVRKAVERNVLSSHGEAGRYFVTFIDNHDMRERFRAARSDASDPFDPQVVLAVALLFCLQGVPCLYYGTEQGLHGRGDSDQNVREALWGKPNAFDVAHPFYKAFQNLSAIRDSQPPLRYGRLYFRPISGDGVHFGASPFAPGVLAFSRILNNQEVVVVANADARSRFDGFVLVDRFIHVPGDSLRCLTNPTARPPASIQQESDLEIHELDGGVTSGPANMIPVSLDPMEVQILAM